MNKFKFSKVLAATLVVLITAASFSNVFLYAARSESYAVDKYSFTYVPEGRPVGMPKFTGDIFFPSPSLSIHPMNMIRI